MSKCRSCKSPALEGKTRCAKHNAIHLADAKRRKVDRGNAGVCTACGKLPESGRMCNACKSRCRVSSEARRAAGFCMRCTGNLATAGIMCERCWFRKMAGDNLGMRGERNRPGAEQLKHLFDLQGGLCALTGDVLRPGSNASLDHIVPRSRGGSDELTNLRWTTFHANVAKRDLTDEEFKTLCRKVSERAQKGDV